MGRKRLESFGSGTIAPSFRMDGDNPVKKISPVSSNAHVLMSSDALERWCPRVTPIIDHHSAGTRAWHEHQCFMEFIYISVVA